MDVYYSPKQFEVFQDVINSVDSKEKKDTVQLPDDEATEKERTPEDKDTPDA